MHAHPLAAARARRSGGGQGNQPGADAECWPDGERVHLPRAAGVIRSGEAANRPGAKRASRPAARRKHPPAAAPVIRPGAKPRNQPGAGRACRRDAARAIRSGEAATRPSEVRAIRPGAGRACRRGGAKRQPGAARLIRSGRAELCPPGRGRPGRPSGTRAAPLGAEVGCRRGAASVHPTGAAQVIHPGRAELRPPPRDRRVPRAQVRRLGADVRCLPGATAAAEGQARRGAAAPCASRERSTQASAGSASAPRACPGWAFGRRPRGVQVAAGRTR